MDFAARPDIGIERPLLAKTDISFMWNDAGLLYLKTQPEQVIWMASWPGPGPGGTIQARNVRRSWEAMESHWFMCGICSLVYQMLVTCGANKEIPLTYEHVAILFNNVVGFLEQAVIADILLEGWGYSFALGLQCIVHMGLSMGLGKRFSNATSTIQQGSQALLKAITRGVDRGWPVKKANAEKGHRDVTVDFRGGLALILEVDSLLQKLRRSLQGEGNHRWLFRAGLQWVDKLLTLSGAWNHGGVAPSIDAHRLNASIFETRRLVMLRTSRNLLCGWHAAVLAATLTSPVGPGLEELELLVFVHAIADVGLYEEWAAVTRAFKVPILEKVQSLEVWCLWPEKQNAFGEKLTTRGWITSMGGIWAGCSAGPGALCREASGNPIASIRIRCPVPWRNRLRGLTSAGVALNVPHAPTWKPLRVWFTLKSEARKPPTDPPKAAICLFLPAYTRIENQWGDLLGSWLWYHLGVLSGIDRVFLYDLDGSLFGKRSSWPRGVVYEPFFAQRSFSSRLANLSRFPACPYCAEALAYDHCLARSRGVVSHLLVLHGVDKWLVPQNAHTNFDIAAHLRSKGDEGKTVYIEPRRLHYLQGRRGNDHRPSLLHSAMYKHISDGNSFAEDSGSSQKWWFATEVEGVAYIDTHQPLHEPRVARKRSAHASVLREWRINYYIDYMHPRYWNGEAMVSGEVSNISQYVEDHLLFQVLRYRAAQGSAVAAALLHAQVPRW